MSPLPKDGEHNRCLRKIPFTTRKAAQECLQRVRKHSKMFSNPRVLRVYTCRDCGMYHIGNRMRKEMS